MRTFGLIGYPLTHSFSKKYFTEQFEREGTADCKYELFSLENITGLVPLLAEQTTLSGLNVTIPHKVNVLPYLDELDDAAEQIGAVNCIAIRSVDNKPYLKGYNTDAYGFAASLKPLLQAHHTKALILGNGGAAKAVKYVLHQLGISYQLVVRTAVPGAITYEEVTPEMIATHQLIINTTPLGMYPDITAAPSLPYHLLSPAHIAYDLIYNPEETAFLQKAKAEGAVIKNGMEMLHLQADRSWEIWNA